MQVIKEIHLPWAGTCSLMYTDCRSAALWLKKFHWTNQSIQIFTTRYTGLFSTNIFLTLTFYTYKSFHPILNLPRQSLVKRERHLDLLKIGSLIPSHYKDDRAKIKQDKYFPVYSILKHLVALALCHLSFSDFSYWDSH